MSGIRDNLTGQRLSLVRAVFANFDLTGTRKASITEIVESFTPQKHPDVRYGKSSARSLISQFTTALFRLTNGEDEIPAEMFEQYYANISTFIDSDDEFEDLIKSSYDIDFTPPPPPEFRMRHGKVSTVHLSASNHGNIVNWNQRPSKLESRAQRDINRTQSVQERNTFNFNEWASNNNNNGNDSLEGQSSLFQMKRRGEMSNNAPSQGNMIEWDTSTSPKPGIHEPLPQHLSSSHQRKKYEEDLESNYERHPTELRRRNLNPRVHANLHGECPFGLTPEEQSRQNQTPSSNKPVSLADMLG